MAFVSIVKGNKHLSVTKGAYINQFSKAGWQLVEGEDAVVELPQSSPPVVPNVESHVPEQIKEPKHSPEDVEEPEFNEDVKSPLSDEELLEVPIDEMTRSELKRAADLLGLNWRGSVKNTSRLREMIKTKLSGG